MYYVFNKKGNVVNLQKGCILHFFDDGPRSYLKVSKFQNEFMRSSFLPKYEPNIVRIEISALNCAILKGRNSYDFWFTFWEKR